MAAWRSGLIAACLTASIGLSAQEPGSGAARSGGAGARAAGPAQGAGSKPITVDGCIQAAPAGTAASGAKYVLAVRPPARGAGAGRGAAADAADTGTEATAATQGTQAAATAGETGSAAATGAAAAPAGRGRGAGPGGPPAPSPRYYMDGDEKTIAPHLNHVVEVTGTLSGEPAPPARGGGAGPAPITQTMKIQSLKMVAALCQ